MEATVRMSVGVLSWRLVRSSRFWLEYNLILAQIPPEPICALVEAVGVLSLFVVLMNHCW